jgi:hypothetical protein
MGRPKGSKNRQAGAAKAAKSAPRSDGVTTTKHNIAAAAASLTDDERQALTRHHVGQYKRDLEAKKAADATFKNTCKKAKSDGVALSEIKTFIEMETPEGEKRVAENLEQSLRIARWLGSNIGDQLGLFANGEADGDPAGAAYRAGKRAAMENKKGIPPSHYDRDEWLRGYQDAQAALIESMGTKEGAAAH